MVVRWHHVTLFQNQILCLAVCRGVCEHASMCGHWRHTSCIIPRILRRPLYVDIHRRVGEHIEKYDTSLEIVNKRKLRLFGHVVTRLRAKGNHLARVQSRGKIKRKACRWLDDVKEWKGLSSNEIWSEHAEDREAWRQHVSRVAQTDWIVYIGLCHAIFTKIVLARITHLESGRLQIF